MMRPPLRRLPSWSVPIALPQNQLAGTDSASWFTARPRSLQIAAIGAVFALALGWLTIHNARYALAMAAGLAVIVVVVIRPNYGALGLVALVPALSGLVPGVPVPNVRISEVLIGAVGVTLLVVTRRTNAVPWDTIDWLLLAYGVLWTVDGVVGASQGHQSLSVSSWGTVAGQLQFFLLYRSVKVTLRTSLERHLALRVLYVASAVVAFLAVLQEIRVPGVGPFITTLSAPAASGGGGGVLRATGPFDNWAALAGYLLPLVLIALCLGLGDAVRSHRRIQVFIALLLTLTLFFTVELSVIVCLLIGVCVLGVRYGRGRMVLRWLGIGLLVVALGAGNLLVTRLQGQFAASGGTGRPALVPQTLGFRWTVWSDQYIPAIEKKPLAGYGVELPKSIEWAFPESQYIEFLIQGGVPLLAMFGLLAWAMLRMTRRASRSEDPVDRALGEGLFISVVIMLVVNLIWPFLSNGGLPQLLWCLFALLPPSEESQPTALLADRHRGRSTLRSGGPPRAIAFYIPTQRTDPDA
jgi:hypothetical protein